MSCQMELQIEMSDRNDIRQIELQIEMPDRNVICQIELQIEMSDRNVIAQIELQIEMSDVRKICRLKCQKQGQKRKEETMNLNSRNYGLLLKTRGHYLWRVLSV